MKPDSALLFLTLASSTFAAVIDGPRQVKRFEVSTTDEQHELYKRRGGGGGGGKGGGGGSSSGGGKSGSSKSDSSSGSSKGSKGSGRKSGSKGSSSPGSSGSGSSSSSGSGSSGSKGSNGGGSSKGGSGPRPSYGGGRYYGGGAAAPYRSGGRSPIGGILPFVLLGSALAFWPGVWLYGAYMYHYPNQYHYYNSSSAKNESRDVICGCARYQECGCDDNNDTAYYTDLIGDGDYNKLNKSIVNVAEVNGTMSILINGTLPNGTTVDAEDSPGGQSLRTMVEALGFWPAVAAVVATCFLL